MEKMRNNSKQKVETFSRILKVFEKGESLQPLLYCWKWPVEDPSWTVSPVWGWRCASHAWARPVPPPTCSKSPSPPADALKLLPLLQERWEKTRVSNHKIGPSFSGLHRAKNCFEGKIIYLLRQSQRVAAPLQWKLSKVNYRPTPFFAKQ